MNEKSKGPQETLNIRPGVKAPRTICRIKDDERKPRRVTRIGTVEAVSAYVFIVIVNAEKCCQSCGMAFA